MDARDKGSAQSVGDSYDVKCINNNYITISVKEGNIQ